MGDAMVAAGSRVVMVEKKVDGGARSNISELEGKASMTTQIHSFQFDLNYVIWK